MPSGGADAASTSKGGAGAAADFAPVAGEDLRDAEGVFLAIREFAPADRPWGRGKIAAWNRPRAHGTHASTIASYPRAVNWIRHQPWPKGSASCAIRPHAASRTAPSS